LARARTRRVYRELTLREKIFLVAVVMWVIVLAIIAVSYYTIE
jgi:cell division protein FtsL